MTKKIEIKMEPVPGSQSGEFFTFTVKLGVTLSFDIDNFTSISTNDGTTTSTQFIPTVSDKMLTISDIGNGFQEKVFMIPVRNIRWIKCYS